jgi:hypothetical protein
MVNLRARATATCFAALGIGVNVHGISPHAVLPTNVLCVQAVIG